MKFDGSIIQTMPRALLKGLTAFFGKGGRPAVASNVTACDLGRSKIILLEIQRRSGAEICITKFELVRNKSQEQRSALLLKPCFDEKKFHKDGIRVTLKGHGVIIRFVRFPKMKADELKSALKYEVEQYIPFEIQECVIDYAIVDESVKTEEGERMEVMLVVVKRQELEPTLEIFRSIECKLSIVDVDILSAMTALEFFHPKDFAGHVGLLDIGTEISTLGVIRDGKPRFIRDISYGTFDMQKRVRSRTSLTSEAVEDLFELGSSPAPEADAAIAESMEGLVSDLKVSFDYYRDQNHAEGAVEKIFVCGGGALHPVVLRSLSNGLGVPVECLEVLSKLKWAETVDAGQLRRIQAFLPVALGLALRPE